MLATLLVAAVACSGADQITSNADALVPTSISASVSKSSTTIANVTLSPATFTVAVGATQKVSINVTNSAGQPISKTAGMTLTWKSSDATIASVSSEGVVTGKKGGIVKITATVATSTLSKTGTSTATVPMTGTTSTTSTGTTSTGTTSTTTTGTTSTTSTSSSEPLPLTGDILLLDTRQSMQSATLLSSAMGVTKLSSATVIGAQTLFEMGGPWAFTTDMDGAGKHALRVDWKNWNGVCADQSATLITYLPKPYQTHVIVSWKQLLGRTATGGGVGNVGSFQVTNPNCGGYNNTGGNAARKEFMMLRDVPNMGSAGRIEFLWAGPAPATPKITSDALNLSFNTLSGVAFDPQAHVGQVITQTIELQAASSATATDGIVRLWINGVKVIENTHAPLTATAFERFQLPTTFNSPMQAQSEYFWDIVAWTPVP